MEFESEMWEVFIGDGLWFWDVLGCSGSRIFVGQNPMNFWTVTGNGGL